MKLGTFHLLSAGGGQVENRGLRRIIAVTVCSHCQRDIAFFYHYVTRWGHFFVLTIY